jgi:hypothetical protein
MRLRKTTIYVATALLATGAVATYATTPVNGSAASTPTLEMSPYAEINDSKKLLLFVSQAERLIFRDDYSFAKMHLNEAMNAASRLSANAEEGLYRVTLVKVMDGTRERQLVLVQPTNITEPLSFSPDALPADKKTVASASVRYISPNWDKATLLTTLSKTLHAIETGKKNAVDPELAQLHAAILKGNEQSVSDRRAAQDNVALARALLQAGAYDAAKLALVQADTHIKKIAAQKHSSPKRFEDIAHIRNEMASVNEVIERKEPSAFKALDAKLEKWWNSLS